MWTTTGLQPFLTSNQYSQIILINLNSHCVRLTIEEIYPSIIRYSDAVKAITPLFQIHNPSFCTVAYLVGFARIFFDPKENQKLTILARECLTIPIAERKL